MTTIYRSEEGRRAVLDVYRGILAAWPVANRQYHVPTSQGETFVVESGDASGPPLLLLHGSLSNSFTWYGDVVRLGERFRVFAVDLVGEAGLSSESRPDLCGDAYVRWMEDVLDGLGLARCALVGMSLGGWVALRFATVRPERVDRLALLCPGGLAPQRRDFALRMRMRSLLDRGDRAKSVSGALGTDGASGAEAEGMRRAMEYVMLIVAHEKPQRVLLPVFAEAEIARLAMPVLVVFGDRDALLDAKRSVRRVQRLLPHAQAVLLPGVGHAVLGQTERVFVFLTAG